MVTACLGGLILLYQPRFPCAKQDKMSSWNCDHLAKRGGEGATYSH